jgi:hypothetical protein
MRPDSGDPRAAWVLRWLAQKRKACSALQPGSGRSAGQRWTRSPGSFEDGGLVLVRARATSGPAPAGPESNSGPDGIPAAPVRAGAAGGVRESRLELHPRRSTQPSAAPWRPSGGQGRRADRWRARVSHPGGSRQLALPAARRPRPGPGRRIRCKPLGIAGTPTKRSAASKSLRGETHPREAGRVAIARSPQPGDWSMTWPPVRPCTAQTVRGRSRLPSCPATTAGPPGPGPTARTPAAVPELLGPARLAPPAPRGSRAADATATPGRASPDSRACLELLTPGALGCATLGFPWLAGLSSGRPSCYGSAPS